MPMKLKTSNFYLITVIVSLGGYLFGFDTVVADATIKLLRLQYELSAAQFGLFVSSGLVGGMFGIALSGCFIDVFGKRALFFASGIFYFLSSIGLAFSGCFLIIVFIRFIAGLSIGITLVVSPIYIGELAPSNRRGSLIVFYQLAVFWGALMAFFLNMLLQHFSQTFQGGGTGLFSWMFVTNIWRGMFLMAALSALCYCVLLFMLPERLGAMLQFRESYKTLIAFSEIAHPASGSISLGSIIEMYNTLFRSLIALPLCKLVMLLIFFIVVTPFTGINYLIYHFPRILKGEGLWYQEFLSSQLLFGTASLLFIVLVLILVDRWGRRSLFLFSSLICALAMAIMGLGLMLNSNWDWLFLGLLLTVLFCSIAIGALKILLATEVFPTVVRATGMSVCMMVMWLTDWCMYLLYPLLEDTLGFSQCMFVFSLGCTFSFFYAKKRWLESKGKSLNKIANDWQLRCSDNQVQSYNSEYKHF